MKLNRRPLKVATEQTQEKAIPVLAKLEKATIRLMEFEGTHQELFEAYRDLQEAVTVAEDEVRTWSKQSKRSSESELFTVKYSEGHSRWYDPDVIEAKLRDLLGESKAIAFIEANDLIVSHEEVDEKVLKALHKLGKIPKSVLDAAYREEPTSARVEIKRKG